MGKRALGEILENWGKKNPEEALRWLDERGDKGLRNRMMDGLLGGWADEEPEQAMAYAMEFSGDAGSSHNAVETVLHRWANKDFEAARAWVEEIEDPVKKEDALIDLIRSFSWRDPQKGADLAVEFKDNPRVLREIENMAWRMARTDPQGSVDWALEHLPEGNQRSQFIRRVVGEWADDDPEKAASYLGRISDERQRGSAYGAVASRMATSDLDGAIEWANGLEDGSMKDKALAGVAGQYAEQNPLKASEWLQTFEEGNARDLSVFAFANRIAAKDPQGAWDWAVTIADPNRRNRALEEVAETMLDLNRAEHEAFIRESDLISAETKWQLLDQ